MQYIEQTGFSVAGQVGRVGVSLMPRLGITIQCGLGVRHDQIRRSHAVLHYRGRSAICHRRETQKSDAHDKDSAPYTQRKGQEWNMFCVEWQISRQTLTVLLTR